MADAFVARCMADDKFTDLAVVSSLKSEKERSDNLAVICPECHMILHSGLWCAVRGVIKLFRKSNHDQNEIINMTREMKRQGNSDQEIIRHLGLREPVRWMLEERQESFPIQAHLGDNSRFGI